MLYNNIRTPESYRNGEERSKAKAETITVEYRGSEMFKVPETLSTDKNYKTLKINGKCLPADYKVTFFDYDNTMKISVRGKSCGPEGKSNIPKKIFQTPGQKRAIVSDKNGKFIGIMFFNVE